MFGKLLAVKKRKDGYHYPPTVLNITEFVLKVKRNFDRKAANLRVQIICSYDTSPYPDFMLFRRHIPLSNSVDFFKINYILISQKSVELMALLNDITLGQYYPTESILHRLDPRTKLLLSLVFTSCLLISHKLSLVAVHLLVCVVAVILSRVPARIFLGTMRWFVWLFLITFCVHTFRVHFLDSFPFVSFEASQQGFLNGISYSTRLGLLIVFASLLTLTTSPTELTDSLERLFSPLKKLKLPVHEFALMMTLAIRFIPILIREANRIKNAQLSRGASLEGSLIHRVRAISPMVLPLFVSAFRRADELAVAMEARNYGGGQDRSSFQQMAFKRDDVILLVFSFVFMGLIVFLN